LYEKGEKKFENFIFESVLGHEMLREGRKEGKKDIKDSEKDRS
jgi:hypothetical protein